jgi:hypothetical protein
MIGTDTPIGQSSTKRICFAPTQVREEWLTPAMVSFLS